MGEQPQDQDYTNPTAGESFAEVLERRLSRRGLIAGAGAVASALVLKHVLPGSTPTAEAASALTFQPIKLNLDDKVTVAPGYEAQVLLRWGDPLFAGVQAIGHDLSTLNQTAVQQERRFGYNNDFVGYFPLPAGSKNSDHGLLAVNHEYTNEVLMFGSYNVANPEKGQVDVALAAHGLSVVEVRREDGVWSYDPESSYNRRLTGETPMDITGPAAGHAMLKVSYDDTGRSVRGMLNNCAGGKTPWGTVLTCEENFNQYFGNLNALPDSDKRKAMHTRYGLTTGRTERNWEKVYDRFDLAKEPNEPFRFGWVVEIDPFDPNFKPKKRTALGRVKHEAATTVLAKDGRAVVYTGDDERFDYMYKFVSEDAYNPASKSSNLRLLDKGTLYVAKFRDDGSGSWLPVMYSPDGPLNAAAGFASQADVLIYTRGAGDVLGATKMDRPEDIETNPVNGKVYAVMTNNTNRTASQLDGPNPRANNKHGHIIELTEGGNDPASTSFTWNLFLQGGPAADGGKYGAFPASDVSVVSCPDNIAFDVAGNLWIATDGQQASVGMNDGIYAVPTAGADRGHARLFLTAPFGAEMCGPEFTPDGTTFFCAIQHPGEPNTGPNSANSSIFKPTSTWPDGDAPPKPAVLAVVNKLGGVIGS